MNADDALRNLREIMAIYNRMSEQCFAHCINDLGQRQLSGSEEACVEKCVNKNMKVKMYMKFQQEFIQKRLQEREASHQGVMQVNDNAQ